VERPVPPGVDALFAPTLELAGERDIVILAGGLNLYVSSDDGLTWRNDTSVISKSAYFSRLGLVEDAAGYYVYQDFPARLAYSAYGARSFQLVSLPSDLKEILSVTPLKSALIVRARVMVWSEKTRVPFFTRAKSGGDWQTHYLPKGTCGPVQSDDATGAHLSTLCATETYQSSDGGASWSPR
jgi:hypothetical protein